MAGDHRLLNILDSFDLEHRALTAAQIAERVNEPQSSVYRSLRSLREAGYVDVEEDGLYRLQPKVLRLAAIAQAEQGIIWSARKPMQRVARQLRQTTVLSVISGNHAICLGSVSSGRPLSVAVPAGKLIPLDAGATARVLLAYMEEEQRENLSLEVNPHEPTAILARDMETLEHDLAEIRSKGYDVTHGNYEEGVSAYAVPIFDYQKQVSASLSIVGITEGMNEAPGHIVEILQKTAHEITEAA